VAVLTWRGEAATRRCLGSLAVLNQRPADVVVVDNDSGTGEGRRLATEFGVAALTLPRNGGVGYGYNAAIRWARERGCSHVLLLNNDTVVGQPDVLERLVEACDEGTAAVGPVVVEADGSVWSAGGVVRWTVGHAQRVRAPRQSLPYAVDWLDGSALLLSIGAACRIGGLSEDFFLYWEETDWCVRASRAGLRCVVQPLARITHERGRSATGRQTRFYALRNSLLFMRRNGSPGANLTSLVAYLLVRLPVFVARRLREGGSIREVASDALAALGWNVRDAVRRRAWRRPAEGADVCGPAS
jgi:GT2 family glycosyltransferase